VSGAEKEERRKGGQIGNSSRPVKGFCGAEGGVTPVAYGRFVLGRGSGAHQGDRILLFYDLSSVRTTAPRGGHICVAL